jgi:hypothetical protein
MAESGQPPVSPPIPGEEQHRSLQSHEQGPQPIYVPVGYYYQQPYQHPQVQHVEQIAGSSHGPEPVHTTHPSPNASRPTSLVAQEATYATRTSPVPLQYGYTPPTPPSQFSSQHSTPHMSFIPTIGTPDTRYSRLIPVNNQQDRALTANEEQYMYRENRSTVGSSGLDSLTTVHENDTAKEVAQQPHPYKEIVSPPLQGQEFQNIAKGDRGVYGQSPEAGSTPYYYSQQPEPPQFAADEGRVPNIRQRKERRTILGIPLSMIIGVLVILSAIGLGLGLYFGLRKA